MYYAITFLAWIALFTVFIKVGVKNFNRKVFTALYTSLLAIITLNIMEPIPPIDGGLFLGIFVYAMYLVPTIFIYGITCSTLSDYISSKTTEFSGTLSLALHILFGLAFILPYGVLFESLPFLEMRINEIVLNPVTMLSVLCAITFFLIETLLKRGFKRAAQKSSFSQLHIK